MRSTATTIEGPKKSTEKPSKAVQTPSESRAPRRARTVQTPSESRAPRRARTAPTPGEKPASGAAAPAEQAAPSAAPTPTPRRAITMIESPPTIRREVAAPHAIDIYGLPNYDADQRTDPGARELRGQLPGGSNLGIEILARWGSGHYWLIERDSQSRLGKQTHFYLPPPSVPETEAIEDDEDLGEDDEDFIEGDDSLLMAQENFQLKLQLARLKERDRIRAEMPQQAAPAAPSLKDQLDLLLKLDELRGRGGTQSPPPPPPKSLIEQLQELKQAEAILAPKRENPPPPPPVQPEAPADPRVTVLQMLLDDPDSAKGMASKLRGLFSGETELPPEPQTTFWDFAMSAMENLAPVLPVLAQRFLGNANGPAVEAVEVGQANPQGIQPPPATPASKPAQPQRMTPDEHFSRASQIVIDGMMSNARQQEAADALKSVIDRNRTYAPTVIELVKLSPGEVIEQLKPLWAGQPGMADKLNAPHVIPWLANVLDRVRNVAGIEPGEAPDDEDGSAGSET